MKQLIIGTFRCGNTEVQLVLREGTGGEMYGHPGDIHHPRIKVGADAGWTELVGWVLHEAMELTLHLKGCRYDPTGDMSRDHSSYIFVANHIQFSDACASVAEFMAEALPEMAKAWKKWRMRR